MAVRRMTRMWRLTRLVVPALLIWPLLAWGAASVLVVREELVRADAILVLSGSSEYVERARRAAQLFNDRRAAKIILTNDNQRGGWSVAQQRNPFFVERTTEELRRAGVPPEKIEVLPQAVSSTYEEAVLLRDYATTNNLRSVLVVTSAYHSRRALWTVRHVLQGSDIELGIDAVAPGEQTPSPATWWWHRRGWRTVATEYPKIIYYWVRYR